MSDTIYREDVINALEKLSACEEYGVEVGTDEETYIGKYEAITAISDLPPVDRPQGEWVTVWDECGENENGYECSECGAEVDEKFPNCPYCRARMKGENDE